MNLIAHISVLAIEQGKVQDPKMVRPGCWDVAGVWVARPAGCWSETGIWVGGPGCCEGGVWVLG